MAEITARGRVPLLVGGTMLYFKALREGLADLPQADPALRAAIDAEAAARGWPALHAELAQLDPETAARLAPNRRPAHPARARSACACTGQPLGELLRRASANDAAALPHCWRWRWCRPTAPCCTSASPSASTTMLAAGLVDGSGDAARASTGCTPTCRRCAASATARSGKCSKALLPHDELRDRGIFATRQFAKRQLTWLKKHARTSRRWIALAPETSARA